MRSILFVLVLLVATSEEVAAATFTVTVANHRAIGTDVVRSYGMPCSGGERHNDRLQDTATYTCDTGGRQDYPDGGVYLFYLASPRGVLMCSLIWHPTPWRESSWTPTLPPGLHASQNEPTGQPNDKTRPGCIAKQLGPDAYQVDTYVASGWLGDEY